MLRSQRCGLVILALLAPGLLLPSTSDGKVDDRPIVVVREDDVRATWRIPYQGLDGMSALDYGKWRRIPLTWGIVTDLAKASTGLTWVELKDYLDTACGEAASHSVTHTTCLSPELYLAELRSSKSVIEANLPGYACRTFLQPGAWRDYANLDRFDKLSNDVSQGIAANYAQSMAYLGGGWLIGKPYYRYGMTNSYNIDYQTNPSIPALKATLNVVAGTPGLLFVISCHGVQEAGDTQTYHVPADTLKALMDTLADMRDAGRIRLMGLDEAYRTPWSSGLNHIPDSGFEHCSPGPDNPEGPWKLYGDACVSVSGGIGDTKYGRVIGTGSQLRSRNLVLAPGRYELSWYQRVEPGYRVATPLFVSVSCVVPPEYTPPTVCANNIYSVNSQSDTWERRTALLLVGDGVPHGAVYFIGTAGAGYGIDDVSLVSAPLDPALSATCFKAVPSPTSCLLSWLTPADVSVDVVCVRCNSGTHPKTPTDGTALATIRAVAGSRQELLVPIDWATQDWVYFSVFAVRADGAFQPPDLAVLHVDKTAPSVPEIGVVVGPGAKVGVQCCAHDEQSGVFAYKYGVGTSPGADDVVSWATTTQSSFSLTKLPARKLLCVSVRAKNAFGYYSAPACSWISIDLSPSDALAIPDGTAISVSGTVSAVFSDCYYVADPTRAAGIKVIGPSTALAEGMEVTLSGVLTTAFGERAICLR